MVEITLHPASRISIRPAIVEVDEEENEVIVGMGTAQEISFEQLVEAVSEAMTGTVDDAINDAINGPITNLVDNAIDELDKLTPQAAPPIEVGEAFDQTELQTDFDNLVAALVSAGVLTEAP